MARARRLSRLAGVALVAAVVVVSARSRGAAFVIEDMHGREVVLSEAPRRIVSLVPSVTELIHALGGEDRLAGRTDFCDYPVAARRVPSVGGMLAPDLETIVALEADLVVATRDGNREETFIQLRRLGIPTFVVAADRVGDVYELIARVGRLTGREAAVGPLVERLQERIAAVQRAVASYRPPRVLYVLWPDPLIVPGRDVLVSELIRIAGGDSITAREATPYPRYSVEAAVARAPEVVILASHGANIGDVARDKWQRLTSLPAIKAGRIHAVDGNLLHRYGPRMVEGLEDLARAIHPKAFK
ncbi:MAG: ABC transporter substrate-binding protein [Candidatus Rokuibacteriota bacterium]